MRIRAAWWLVAAALGIFGGGGGGSGGGGTTCTSNCNTTSPPSVSAVTPTNTSTGIAITSAVTATFSEPMNASTITGSTFTLVPQGGSAVAATVSYNASGNVATL